MANKSVLILPDGPNNDSQEQTKITDSYSQTLDQSPDKAASVIKIAKKTGSSPGFVAENFNQAKQMEDAWTPEQLNEWSRIHPKSTNFVSDPKNMVVAKDDLGILGSLERGFDAVKEGFKQGALETEYARLSEQQRADTSVSGIRSTKNEARLRQIETNIQSGETASKRYKGALGFVYQPAKQVSNLIYSGIEALKGFAGGGLAGGGVSLALGQLGPQVALPEEIVTVPTGIAVGGKLGASAKFFDAARTLEAGSAYRQYINLKDSTGQPIEPRKAADTANLVGLANATLESVGTLAVGKLFAAPLAKTLASAVSKVPGSEKLFSMIQANPKVFEKMTISQAVREAGKRYILGIGAEVGTEYAQEVATNTGQAVVQKKPISSKTASEIAAQSTKVIVPTIQSVALLGLAGTGAHIFNSTRAIKKAEQAKQFYEAVGDTVAASKLRERLPEKMQEHLDNLTKNGPVENVYIPHEAFTTYFQSKNIDPESAAQELGISEQFNTSKQTGEDLQVPMSKWASEVVATEHYKGLANDIKFDPEDLTVNQAKEREKEVGQSVQDAENKITDAQTGYETVYQYIRQQQIDAGKPKGMKKAQWDDLVEQNSRVFASQAVAEATRRGVPVLDYFQGQNKPSVQQGLVMPSFGDLRQEDVQKTRITDSQEFKKWFGDSKVVDKNGEPLVVYHGTDSDFEAFDLSKSKMASKANPSDLGFWFVDDSTYANHHGKNVLETYVSIKNPKIYTREQWNSMNMQQDFKGIKKSLMNHGYDGVLIEESFDTFGRFDVRNPSLVVAFTPEQIKSVNNRGTFDPNSPNILFQDEKLPRGSVQFADSGSIINLFKTADASTFLHEASHIWLKSNFDYVKSGQADEAYLSDWKTLSEWLGVATDQESLRVEQQEKFASAFETYLKEGVSPSLSLQKAFSAFKRWLTRIYGAVRGIRGVEISDEIRGVLDRMIATEDEIRQAQEQIGASALQDLTGYPDEVVKRVKSLQDRAREKAESILLPKVMADLSEDRKQFLKDERKRFSDEIQPEIARQEVYRNMQNIREAISKNKTAKTLSNDYKSGKMKDEARLAWDVFAEEHGYDSGDQMANDFIDTPTVSDAVKNAVDDHMLQFEDMLGSDSMKAAAMEAIHNSYSTELLAIERDILEKRLAFEDQKNTEIVLKESMKHKQKQAEVEARWEEAFKRSTFKKAQIDAKAAKSYARDVLAKKTVKDAVRFRQYFTAERDAAVRVAKALAKKDYASASFAKHQQLINHALATEAMNIAKQIEKDVAYLEKAQKLKRDAFKTEEHFQQAAAILQRFGFSRRDFDAADKSESLDAWIAKYDEITNIVEIPDWVAIETISRDYRTLTPDQLSDVRNSVANIRRVANMEDRAYVTFDKADIADIARTLLERQQQTSKDRRKPSLSNRKDLSERLKSGSDEIAFQLVNLETFLRKLDGHENFGPWWRAFYEPITRATDKSTEMLASAATKYREIIGVYSKDELKKIRTEKIDLPELGGSLTKEEILSMALNWGNETNKDRLLIGRNWTAEDVASVFDKHMDKRDWDFVQNTWDLINEQWPGIAEMYKDLTGFTPDKVEANPVETPSGTYPGGYYPLKKDPSRDVSASKEKSVDSALITEPPLWKASTKNGHTKDRASYAEYPILLSLSVIPRHLNDVIHDLNFRRAVLDLNRIMNKRDVQEAITNAYGTDGYRMFQDWVNTQAWQNRQIVIEGADKIWRGLRRRTILVALGGRLTTLLLQFTGFSPAAGIDPDFRFKHVINASAGFYSKVLISPTEFGRTSEFVRGKSAYMAHRMENVNRDISDVMRDAFSEHPPVERFALGIIGTFDSFVAIPLWKEAYSVGLEKYDGNDQRAIDYADMIVRRSQSSGQLKDLAKVMRGPEFKKLFTMFYSYMNTMWNAMYEAGSKVDSPKDLPVLLGTITALWFIPFIIEGAIKIGAPTDEEKLKRWLSQFMQSPFQYFPIVRDIAATGIDQMLGIHDTYSPTPVIGGLEAIYRAMGSLRSENATGLDKLEAASKAGEYIIGYPDQFHAWFWNLTDYAANRSTLRLGDVLRRRPRDERGE